MDRCQDATQRLTKKQVIHSLEPTEQISRHQKALRKRIKESIFLTAANDDTEIDQKEVKRRIFLEEASKKVRKHTRPIQMC